ncbi:hypothetical protein [Sediminibacter sp. Hel_I_10]|uniref:hypothetical protein n=1 Tax=Sediminibacter sp. Hel_I_10 TaxID=1392490 RepID=UPI0012DC8F89|nr:hypothetical protein [Sediminibacter sp. Hel_I_10]
MLYANTCILKYDNKGMGLENELQEPIKVIARSNLLLLETDKGFYDPLYLLN